MNYIIKKCFLCSISIIGFLTGISFAQGMDLKFTHLTIEDGLSSNLVWGTIQDHRGFMWFCTTDGLNRYDGYAFTVFRRVPGDTNSLLRNDNEGIYEDQNGNIWIGSQNNGSISRYNPDTKRFFHYPAQTDSLTSLPGLGVNVIHGFGTGYLWLSVAVNQDENKLDRLVRFNPDKGIFQRIHIEQDEPDILSYKTFFPDRSGYLWIVTNSDGLILFNSKTLESVRYQHEPWNANSLSSNNAGPVYESEDGFIWILTAEGVLDKFDRKSGQFTHFKFSPGKEFGEGGKFLDVLPSITEDKHENLWIVTDGAGLIIFNRKNETFSYHQHDPADPQSLNIDRLNLIHRDRSGAIWIGTVGGGINKYNSLQERFTHFKNDPEDPNSLYDNNVWAIYADSNRFIWLGHNLGLDRFDPNEKTFTHYLPVQGNPSSISVGKNISVIYEDSKGILWAGSWGGGLNRFNRTTNTFGHYRYNPGVENSLCSDNVATMYEDTSGNLWTGVYAGLCILDSARKQFNLLNYYYKQNLDTITSLPIRLIFEDPDEDGKILWFGTWFSGLFRFNTQNGNFTHYIEEEDNPNSLLDNEIKVLHQGQKGFLWIGTMGGLNKLDKANQIFTQYSTSKGLPGNDVYGILEDKRDNLWISTNNGLSRFNLQTESFKNYDLSDGLQGLEFRERSFDKDWAGRMYFGGNNGFNMFNPDSIIDNPYIPSVYITDFRLFNRPVTIGGDSPLQKAIWATDSLVLNHTQDIISFEFAALSYLAPEKNFYAYKLEGFETDWNLRDAKQRYVTYTNLPAGYYTLRVIGSNNDRVWNENGVSLQIKVLPPWWETAWFRAFGVVLVLSALISGVWLRERNLVRSRQILENQVNERTMELNIEKGKAETANRAKSVFLATMSHELRTPLNAVLGFARLMQNDPKITQEHNENLGIITRSGEHLLNLINNVLEISKIESGRIELEETPFNLQQLLQEIKSLMYMNAMEKGLGFSMELSPDLPKRILTDSGKLRQVLINLIGNAVKYTEKGGIILQGRVVKSNDSKRQRLRFEVKDTGPGISKEGKDRLFSPFTRLHDRSTSVTGTGLGLAISKQYVELMGGQIGITSEVGKGSVFYFEITVAVLPEEKVPEEKLRGHVIGLAEGEPSYRLLIAEDQPENSLLLRKILEPLGYELREAVNGLEAVKLFEQWHPQLIWMDVRMPVMNGLEACRRIKATEAGAKTKIVMITAHVLEEERREIIAAGSDELIRKPYRDTEIFDALEKHLGVHFVYEKKKTPSDVVEQLDKASLASLPDKQLSELEKALVLLNSVEIKRAINLIREKNANLADNLAAQVKNFQYEPVLRMIQAIRNEKHSGK